MGEGRVDVNEGRYTAVGEDLVTKDFVSFALVLAVEFREMIT